MVIVGTNCQGVMEVDSEFVGNLEKVGRSSYRRYMKRSRCYSDLVQGSRTTTFLHSTQHVELCNAFSTLNYRGDGCTYAGDVEKCLEAEERI